MLAWLLALYVVAKPFYLLPSGLPQPADAFLAVALALLLLRPSPPLAPDAARVVLWASLLVAWIAAVDVGWAVYRADFEFLVPPVFYLYNLALLFLVFRLHAAHGDRFLQFLMASTAVAVFLQVLVSLVVGGGGTTRNALLFNNPNQLGYWALLSGSIFFVCALRVRVRAHWQVAFALGVLHLVVLSLSKGALVALAVLFVLAVLRRPRHLVPAMALAAVGLTAVVETESFQRVQQRISDIGGQSDDSAASRGYDRLWEHPEHLVLGAGEGDFERFRRWDDAEFHSTPGTLLFSYGAVGACFAAAFLVGIGRRAGVYGLAYLVPAMLYGLTHQGLRFSTLWLLLGVIGALRAPPRTARQRARSARRIDASPAVSASGLS